MGIKYIPNNSILYYPSIEFYDEGFVKSSLCIWDTIYRIVPASYIPNDSEEIRTAVQEGVIKNINLSKNDLSEAGEKFMDFITGTPFLPAGLEGYEAIDLHKDKVDARLYPYLEELSKKAAGDWVTLSKPVVHGYMLFLADTICKNRNIPKITDNSDVFSIMAYYENDGQFDERVYKEKAEEYYSSIIIPTLVPTGVESTSIDTVMKFREKTSTGRAEFRDAISNFTDTLKKIKDKEFAKTVTEDFKKQLDESKQNIFETGKEIIKELIPSYLAVGVPTQISTLGLLGIEGNPYSLGNVLKSFFIGAIAAYANGAKKSKSWDSKAASYYINLKSKFGNVPRFDRIFEEFIND